MKALFKFGGFTQFLDVPDNKLTIYIPHPSGMLRVTDKEYGDVTAPLTKKLEFTLKGQEEFWGEKVAVYEFAAVS